MKEQQNNDDLQREQLALDMLLKKGYPFEVRRKSILKYFSKTKVRKFEVKRFYAGQMDYMANEQLKLYLDEDKIKENPIFEKNVIVKKNAKRAAKIIAIALLDSEWKIKIFSPFLAYYLFWRMTSEDLFVGARIIQYMGDAANFIDSIRLMYGIMRPTQLIPDTEANPIEKKAE